MPLYMYATEKQHIITNPLVSHVYRFIKVATIEVYFHYEYILYIVSRTKSRAIFNKHNIFGSFN